MHSVLTYNEMKAKIPEIKRLFETRHYSQCAIRCERLLARTKTDETHPVHQACLNFYFALSHDTMAREATMKKRSSELDLAETHYIAALKALTPPESRKTLEDIQEFQSPTSSTSEDEPNVLQEFQSPTSSMSEDEPNSFGRRPSSVSLNSQHSRASSETSYAEDDDFFADWEFQPSKTSQQFRHSSSQDAQDDYNPIIKLAKRRPSPIITRPAPQSFHAEQFSADLYAFATMVQLHLASVRELKEAATTSTYRYSVSRLQSPTLPSRRGSRDLGLRGDPAGMENLRQGRKSMAFRARFDPSSVQELCQEVLSEL